MRWCLEDISIKIPANRWLALSGACREGATCSEPVQFGKPFMDIREHGFEKDTFLNTAHPHPIAVKTEFLGEPDGPAAAVGVWRRQGSPVHSPTGWKTVRPD